jgi:hypothetical protein
LTSQAHLFGGEGRTDSAEVLADHEADYTPTAVALQLFLALVEQVPRVAYAARCLDPAAGSGVWGQVMRAVLDERARIDAIEPRASEVAGLTERHIYTRVANDAFDASKLDPDDRYDVVATNPPFSAFKAGWWLDLFAAGRLHGEAVVAFLGLSQWGQTKAAEPLLKRWSPTLQIRCGGRPHFRGAEDGSDSREYCLWVWINGGVKKPVRVGWWTAQLPVLPSELRTWSKSAIPGTYPIDLALIAEVRRFL